MAQKYSVPKGTRDFLPFEMARRNHIFNTLKGCFLLFGFQPIETPAMENLSTLLGKYGEEGDKLLFRILNSGDFLGESRLDLPKNDLQAELLRNISEKGLRYDLTVPFARFVVQHQQELTFPFRRYQIQPVWRADRPQKGRYREFFQCDADVIGTPSLLCEAELIQLTDMVFSQLGIRTQLRINNRKILSGIAEAIGHPGQLTDLTVAMDKMDKIGLEGVVKELENKGFNPSSISALLPILALAGSPSEKLDILMPIINNSETGLAGINEVKELIELLQSEDLKMELELDLSLARGLNYYTGAIFEVKALDTPMGSICGGGRYDDLTGVFGLPGVSGVGISFGADRIYDVMQALSLFPEESKEGTRLMLVNFGGQEEKASFKLLSKLRRSNLVAEIYPSPEKMKKQFAYADSRGIPFVGIMGEEELKQGKITLKDMRTGSQTTLSTDDIENTLRGQ